MSAMILYRNLQAGVAEIVLNRSEKANALNAEMIVLFLHYLKKIKRANNFSVLLIRANGNSFCAGADLQWMLSASDKSKEENIADAEALAQLFYALKSLPVITVAKVNGSVFGGGMGLLACCDIVVAQKKALFSFSEVRLGLVPVTILPYVMAVMQSRALQRLVLTAEKFSAKKAKKVGLISQVVNGDQLDMHVNKHIERLLKAEPEALRYCKKILQKDSLPSVNRVRETAQQLADIRVSVPVRSRIQAFLDGPPEVIEK